MLGMASSAIRALKAGNVQGKTAGDPLQQGGVAVVNTSGNVVFIHRDATAGDHLTPPALLTALRESNLVVHT